MNTGAPTVNRGEIVSMYAGLYRHTAVRFGNNCVESNCVICEWQVVPSSDLRIIIM